MSVSFDPLLLNALSGMVTERSGLRFSSDRWADLERGVRAAARELGFADPFECAMRSRVAAEQLAGADSRGASDHR